MIPFLPIAAAAFAGPKKWLLIGVGVVVLALGAAVLLLSARLDAAQARLETVTAERDAARELAETNAEAARRLAAQAAQVARVTDAERQALTRRERRLREIERGVNRAATTPDNAPAAAVLRRGLDQLRALQSDQD